MVPKLNTIVAIERDHLEKLENKGELGETGEQRNMKAKGRREAEDEDTN